MSGMENFLRWRHGRSGVYYRGFLLLDRTSTLVLGSPGSDEKTILLIPNEDVQKVRNEAWGYYVGGEAVLTQRRVGDGEYEYIITRRRA